MEDQFIEEDTEVVDTEEIIAQDPVIEEQEEEQEEQEKSESHENETNKVEQIYNETGIKKQSITFDDMDRVRTMISDENISSTDELVNAPKTLERLEEISMKNFAKRKEEQDNDDDNEDENDAIQIGEPVSLGDLDIDMFSEEV
jgi:hypothetical protein